MTIDIHTTPTDQCHGTPTYYGIVRNSDDGISLVRVYRDMVAGQPVTQEDADTVPASRRFDNMRAASAAMEIANRTLWAIVLEDEEVL